MRDYFDEFGEAGILYVAATINSDINIDEVDDFPQFYGMHCWETVFEVFETRINSMTLSFLSEQTEKEFDIYSNAQHAPILRGYLDKSALIVL